MMGDVHSSQAGNRQQSAGSVAGSTISTTVIDPTVPKFPTPRNSVVAPFRPHTHPITDDYKISKNVLGVGINGKVVECVNRKSGQKYALKVTEMVFVFVLSFRLFGLI